MVMSDLRPSLASGAGTTASRRQRRTHNASLQLVPGVRLAEVILRESPRAGLGDIPRLADSIKANGLLQPIVVTPDKVLVFGHRRVRGPEGRRGATTRAHRGAALAAVGERQLRPVHLRPGKRWPAADPHRTTRRTYYGRGQ